MLSITFLRAIALLVPLTPGVFANEKTDDYSGDAPKCPGPPTTQRLTDLPYDNYFYSDCNVQAQAVITSPEPDSNLSIISPRLIVAWPGGNSGACAYFEPSSGINGTLTIMLINSTNGESLQPVYAKNRGKGEHSTHPYVGISGTIRLNASAVLSIPILGSVRTIRDFAEGPSLLVPEIQESIKVKSIPGGGMALTRLWLDNVTTVELGFIPKKKSCGEPSIQIDDKTLGFEAGDYLFFADYNYPQLTQLNASAVFNPQSQDLITKEPSTSKSLSFLSYTDKLLAGGWRFLTYFGRDSMISALLLQPVLSDLAIEAVIEAVLERINSTDGTIAHEETIGDYATYLNMKENINTTAPNYNYIMVDSDFYLPIIMDNYFLKTGTNLDRAASIFSIEAGKENPANKGLTYGETALKNAEKIMELAGRYAAKDNQTTANLVHLKDDIIVGEWRDSTYGIGGGRIPYDVNTALMPAALRSVAALAKAGIYKDHPEWATVANEYAKIWEDTTLHFFEVNIPASEVKSRLETYKKLSGFAGPTQVESVSNEPVKFYAVALEGNNKQEKVEVMNTDDCFRLFLVNSTDQSQLTAFLNQAANNVRRTFPAGLMTSVSAVVANPAYGDDPVYAANFTTSAYHGTVVWSWQLAMLARGFELQLARCDTQSPPAFCGDEAVHKNVLLGYNTLWDSIEKNRAVLASELWSWEYVNGDFKYKPYGAFPPPAGVQSTGELTVKAIRRYDHNEMLMSVGNLEADIVQLWSLSFLAVTRNTNLK